MIHGHGDHGMGITMTSPVIRTRNRHDRDTDCRVFESPIAPQALAMFLDLLRSAHGPNLLRMKGIVRFPTIRRGPWCCMRCKA
jgi:G3E family GTPase